MFELFLTAFAVLIAFATIGLLRRQRLIAERSATSVGLALGFGIGGAIGLVLSTVAGTFVYILPVSLGVGMALGFGIGWAFESLKQRD